MVLHAESHDVATMIIDFGSDGSIYRFVLVAHHPRVTSTVDRSGDAVTELHCQET